MTFNYYQPTKIVLATSFNRVLREETEGPQTRVVVSYANIVEKGFSVEFCTAIAVVVKGVTLIYTAKGCLYYVERRDLREAWAPIYKFNMAAMFQRCRDIAKRLFGHSVVC